MIIKNVKTTLILIIFLTAAILTHSCQTENVKRVKDDNVNISLVKHQDTQNGFSVNIPKEWVLITNNENIIFASVENDSTNYGIKNNIYVSKIVESLDDSQSLKEIVKSSITDMNQNFQDYYISSREKLNINDMKAQKIICSFTVNTKTATTLLYFIETNKGIFQIGCTSESSVFDKYKKVYNYIASTFHVSQ